MSKKSVTTDRETFQVNPSKVKKDDLMAIIYYVKVDAVNPKGDSMTVRDLTSGLSGIRIDGADLIRTSLSADFFEKEEKATMTRMAEILTTSPNRPLTVCFIKKDGSERILRGRWLAKEDMMGRSFCEDLDVPKTDKEDGIREVDHRTIQWLVVDGVKYKLK